MVVDLGGVPLGVPVGQAVRALRTDAGLRQEDLVKRAASFGLRWDRTVVARLEAGKKRVSLEELLLLGLMFKVPAWELIPGDDLVALSPSVFIRASALRDALAGRRFPITSVDLDNVPAPSADTPRYGPTNPPPGAMVVPEAVQRAAKGDAERKAAKKLNLMPVTVSTTAFQLWGQSLSDKRDAEVASTDDIGSLRARRGRVTRRLVDEIRATLEDADDL